MARAAATAAIATATRFTVFFAPNSQSDYARNHEHRQADNDNIYHNFLSFFLLYKTIESTVSVAKTTQMATVQTQEPTV